MRPSSLGSIPTPVSETSIAIRPESSRRGPEVDAASGRRELDRVLDDVPENLAESRRIRADRGLRIGRGRFEDDVLLGRLLPEHLEDVPERLGEGHRLGSELHLSGRHARQVEEVVDQTGLELRIAPDDLEAATRFGREGGVALERGAQSEHRRQRRPQLVRERRQELILGAVRGFGLLLGPAELGFRGFQVLDVRRGSEPGGHATPVVPDRDDPGEHPPVRAGEGPHPIFDAVGSPGHERAIAGFHRQRPVAGMDSLLPAADAALVLRLSEPLLVLRVDVHGAPVGVVDPEKLLDRLGERPVSFLALPDPGHRVAALLFGSTTLGRHDSEQQERGRVQRHESLRREEALFELAVSEGTAEMGRRPDSDPGDEQGRARRARVLEAQGRPDEEGREKGCHPSLPLHPLEDVETREDDQDSKTSRLDAAGAPDPAPLLGIPGQEDRRHDEAPGQIPEPPRPPRRPERGGRHQAGGEQRGDADRRGNHRAADGRDQEEADQIGQPIERLSKTGDPREAIRARERFEGVPDGDAERDRDRSAVDQVRREGADGDARPEPETHPKEGGERDPRGSPDEARERADRVHAQAEHRP
jgi:hypothetical protein